MTLKPLTSYVDPFLGNGASDPPPAGGLAATWFWPKAQTGNTHPGASYPLGMVSVCAYSGAYVTGYGLNAPSYDGVPHRLLDTYTATGFTHFQQSGTGAIGSYYNYFRVTPLVGGLGQLGARWPLVDETASPGYYVAGLEGTGIRAELTVSRRAALHRYTFPAADVVMVAIDVSAGGLLIPDIGHRMRSFPAEAAFELLSNGRMPSAQGKVVMEGIPLYFYVEIDTPVETWGIWSDGHAIPDRLAWEYTSAGASVESEFTPFGFYFQFATEEAQPVVLRWGFSLKSVEQARGNAQEGGARPFDEVVAETRATWERHLACVQVTGGTEEQRKIFYSLLYFSLLKPADFGEPYWEGDGPFFFDFATLWDMYKTQFPLLLTLCPESGRDVVNALLSLAGHFGEFPNGFVMNTDIHDFDGQASCLAHFILAEAYIRGMTGVDWQRAKHLMARAVRQAHGGAFVREGKVLPYTHTLDLAYAAFCTAQIARGVGDDALAAEMMSLAAHWRNVYDPKTGLLSTDSKYYEGTYWNYSFRLFHDVAGRIALFDSEADFVATLDRFFGYGQPPCVQVHHRPYGTLMDEGFALGRFEGLNNEPDMETPYIYIYAGRHDRTAEIVREVLARQYHTGRGGLPGNDDSGGLASWYVWSAMGLFPVTGQGIFLIGSPIFDGVTLTLGAAIFTIEVRDNSAGNLYVQRAALNGRPLDRAYLLPTELTGGGHLVLEMGPTPSTWAQQTRPPSYR